MNGTRGDFYSIAKSRNYLRVIYKIGVQFLTTYFKKLTEDNVQVIYADSSTYDAQSAGVTPASGLWHTLTSTNPWIPLQMPVGLIGNWHIQDGLLEMVIDENTIEIDGDIWNIDSVQTNKTAERLLLSSGGNYKMLYYQTLGARWMEVRLVDGKVDLQDRFGRVRGNFTGVYKWWDIFESGGFKQGAKWVYDFSYDQIFQVDSTAASPRVVIDSTLSSSGMLEVEVTNSTISSGSGTLSLVVTFTTTEEEGRYSHILRTNPDQILTDTVWADSSLNRINSNQYDLTLENDTLWYNFNGSKELFASARISLAVTVNAEMFLYPVVPTWHETIDWDDRSGIVRIFEDLPPDDYSKVSYGWGGGTKLKFTPSVGFDVIYYDFPDFANGSDTPHEIRNILDCRLVSFSPGE